LGRNILTVLTKPEESGDTTAVINEKTYLEKLAFNEKLNSFRQNQSTAKYIDGIFVEKKHSGKLP